MVLRGKILAINPGWNFRIKVSYQDRTNNEGLLWETTILCSEIEEIYFFDQPSTWKSLTIAGLLIDGVVVIVYVLKAWGEGMSALANYR
ncbi:MAG: hypothetical protein P9L92_17050 [Candidatus Electryonea clarkiae]|nr:hypothetical protein [Candidatus Electryonea clarkiae]MDP8288204.1 hypothetical protein [Candidatus Electryonea clarkiae]